MKIEVIIPDQVIAETLCAGMEGGVNYWSQIQDYIEPTRFDFRLDPKTTFKHIDYPMNPGGVVILKDTETNVIHTLNIHKLCRGVTLMAEHHPKHFKYMISGDSDAETGDVLIQLAIFGEIIYG